MKAITTRYKGPTEKTGSRIVASAESCRTTVSLGSLDYSNAEDAHKKAALILIDKMDWADVKLHTGGLANGDYVHVMESTR